MCPTCRNTANLNKKVKEWTEKAARLTQFYVKKLTELLSYTSYSSRKRLQDKASGPEVEVTGHSRL